MKRLQLLHMHRIITATIFCIMTFIPIMAQQKITQPLSRGTKVTQTAGRQQLGDFAPEFARLNDDILFGEVWSQALARSSRRFMVCPPRL